MLGMSLGSRPQSSEVASDDLKDKYSSAADDASCSQRKREAAVMFSLAEDQLNRDDTDDALKTAESALAIFREIEDAHGEADTLRLILHAHRSKADAARTDGDKEGAKDICKQAEALASGELEKFREIGDKRGQAAMLLSLAELNFNLRGSKKREEALDTVNEALELFTEVKDGKMEALATLLLSRVLYKKSSAQKAKRVALEAVALFQGLGDKKGEALALHAAGSIDALDSRLDDGMRHTRKALKIFTELGDKRQQGFAYHSLAQWAIQKEDGHGALPVATHALRCFREARYGHGWEASALGLVVEAYILQNKGREALDVAQDGLQRFKEAGETRDVIRVLHTLVNAYLNVEDNEQALLSAQEGIELCRDLQDKRWHANMLETLANVHIAMKNEVKAKECAYEAVDLLKQSGAAKQECEAQMHLLARVLVQVDDYQEAVKAAQQARILAQKKDDRNLEAWAMLANCGTYGMVGEIEKSLKAGGLAADLFREEGDKKGEAKSLKGMSDILWAHQDYAGALRYAKQAEAVMQDFGDKRWLAKMKHAVAHVHLLSDNAQEAAKVALEALKICRAEEDVRGSLRTLFLVIEANVTVLGEMQDQGPKARPFNEGCNKALRHAKEAIGLSVKLGDRAAEAVANYWCGSVYVLMGKVDELIQTANTALRLWRELEDRSGEVRALGLIAQSHMMKSENQAAMTQLNEAMLIAREAGDKQGEQLVQQLQEMVTGSQGSQPQQQAPTISVQSLQPPSGQEAAPEAASSGKLDAYKPPEPMMVRQFIIALVQNMTGGAEEVEADVPLMESGIDSLASVELRTQLQQEFKLNLPSTVMFNYPTISAMTGLLVDECTNKKIAWGRK